VFDIINCQADPQKFAFEKFYFLADIKSRIIECDNLEAAANHKNKKVLLSLRDFAFDEGAIKLIAEKKQACFLIDVGRLIRTRGVPRAIALSKNRTFLRLCNKFGAFYAFATFAENESQIRRPEELENIALLFDLNRGQVKFAQKMLQHYL
jgi:RNase P/RNase MRP subunit p30